MSGTRKALALAAVAVTLLSLFFPHWAAMMVARTYPRPLCVHVYAYKLAGDVREWNRVGKLVGAQLPPAPTVVFIATTGAIFGAALLAMAAAFKERFLRLVAVAYWLLVAALAAGTQYNLWWAGHHLDPHRAIHLLQAATTPPLIGWATFGPQATVATVEVPATGAALVVSAAVLMTVAAILQRKNSNRAAF